MSNCIIHDVFLVYDTFVDIYETTAKSFYDLSSKRTYNYMSVACAYVRFGLFDRIIIGELHLNENGGRPT